MRPRVVVIGGAITGASVAWHLTVPRGRLADVTVLERDPTYAQASTALAASGIRHQFSTETNIRISQYGTEFLREHGIPFRENGYLVLADTEAGAARMRRSHALQRRLGADVELLGPDDLARTFPHLATHDVVLASLGRSGEGWFDNMGLLRLFREGSRAAGAEWRQAEAVGLQVHRGPGSGPGPAADAPPGACARAVVLASGETLEADWVVDAAGTRAAQVAGWAGVDLPVEPRKRTVFAFSCADPPSGTMPLMIDASGLWCRPEGTGFIAGKGPDPDPAVAADDFDPRSTEFEEVIWPLLAARVPAFEAIRMTGLWAGHYAWNTHDQNAILGPAPGCANLLLANGFSGHGLQQAPAIGRGLAEMIEAGCSLTLDLSELGAARLSSPPAAETAVY